ncbi:hypothetical protein B0A48_10495 [Cryoendolithus antarcticus]|uniref:Uncharacterized protein n=1 Tax=Cryoendolithus antarcticus TaxID=1507870 RepID=A0A1V8SXQ2_9PEZI|nr:hypothetical protein B0A48_10495 [Cryoendolithus antarcticus]
MLTEGGKALANLRMRHAATHVIIVEPGRKLRRWLTQNFIVLYMSGMGRTAAVCDADEEETVHFGERVWRLEMKEDSCIELDERLSRRSGQRVKGLTYALVGRRLPPNQPFPDKLDKQRIDIVGLQIDSPPERRMVQQTARGPGQNNSRNRPLQSSNQHSHEQGQSEYRKGGNSKQTDNKYDHNAGTRGTQGGSGGYRGGQNHPGGKRQGGFKQRPNEQGNSHGDLFPDYRKRHDRNRRAGGDRRYDDDPHGRQGGMSLVESEMDNEYGKYWGA